MIEMFAGFVTVVMILKLAVAVLLLVCAAMLVINKCRALLAVRTGHTVEPTEIARAGWGAV